MTTSYLVHDRDESEHFQHLVWNHYTLLSVVHWEALVVFLGLFPVMDWH